MHEPHHQLGRRDLLIVAAILTLGLCLPPRGNATPPFSPYADFTMLSQADLATLQIKLRHLATGGDAFVILWDQHSSEPDISGFESFRFPNRDYSSDLSGPMIPLHITTALLDALIDSVGTLDAVTSGPNDTTSFFSFAMLSEAAGTTIAFEAIVADTIGRTIVSKMRGVIPDALEGELVAWACPRYLSALVPIDVTNGVKIVFSGVRLNRQTGRFVSRAVLTNQSATPLQAPITVVLSCKGAVTPIGEAGRTCLVAPEGSPYFTFLDSGSLASNASIGLILEFDNPDRRPLKINTRVYSGPGDR